MLEYKLFVLTPTLYAFLRHPIPFCDGLANTEHVQLRVIPIIFVSSFRWSHRIAIIYLKSKRGEKLAVNKEDRFSNSKVALGAAR